MRTIYRLPIAFSILLALALTSCNPIADRAINKRKRNAQNLASVYASAIAAGANFTSVKNKFDAIEIMRRGVNGADSFSTILFQVPGMSDKEAEKASRYLLFDARGNLQYSDRKVP